MSLTTKPATLKIRPKLIRLRRRLSRVKERLVGGGALREAILVGLLRQHYACLFRRQWELNDEEPHFYSHRMGLFELAFGEGGHGPYSYYRGFFSSEVLREGDTLLDIGCGDGFFTRRFFAERCAHLDAIDIEPSAIEEARGYNGAPNISYYLLDAVNQHQPFPGDKYDVIVWDGALGHFSPDTTHRMLQKIRYHLATEGIFVGSESLGVEGTDHLQFFHSLDDFFRLFQPYFKHIELRSVTYKIGKDGFLRHEGYWRCANDVRRLQDCRWQVYSALEEDKPKSSSHVSNERLSP